MKAFVITTFPNKAWKVYAELMVKSFAEYWPIEVPLMIYMDNDEETKATFKEIQTHLRGTMINETTEQTIDFICPKQSDAHKAFLERHKDRLPESKDYRKRYVAFSNKVFATKRAADFLEAEKIDADYLIWMDADIVTQKKVELEDIKNWCPSETESCAYMGRKDWDHCESGFIIFNMKNGGAELIDQWVSYYLDDSLLKAPTQTDSTALDMAIAELGKPARNLTEGIAGRDVFEQSPMAGHMQHLKGMLKYGLTPEQGNIPLREAQMHGQTLDVSDMRILTKNCVDHEKIITNVVHNLQIVDKWLPLCKTNEEEIVICSAGPSLSPAEIMPFYERGVKIIAVKHALEALLSAGIVPWGCILLDPRAHVADFVKYPHPDTNYFVASMCDTSVTSHLKKCGAKLWGYHASVGAGEMGYIPHGHLLISGGSATSTRGLSLLEMLGFRKIHMFGYDCSFQEKPDLNYRKENGKIKFEEVTLKSLTWGGKEVKRTIWTEGQFMAQVQEYKNIYLPKEHMEFIPYGEGVIPWMHKHHLAFKAWEARELTFMRNKAEAGVYVDELLGGQRKSSGISE